MLRELRYDRAMPRKLKLTIAYEGTRFHGWQRQAGVRCVQEVVEEAARRVLRHPLEVSGASRTDAGVHARGQVAHIKTESEIPANNIRRAIGHRLPSDVALVSLHDVPVAFNAIRHARWKLYRYRIFASERKPAELHASLFAWHVRFPLCADAMQQAADAMTGTRDFAAFASAGSPRQTTVRTVGSVRINRRYREFWIDVEGDGFLYNQVRNMVGTLVEVGRGHWTPARVHEILASGNRQNAGPTAPAHGLCLQWIQYPPLAELDDGTYG